MPLPHESKCLYIIRNKHRFFMREIFEQLKEAYGNDFAMLYDKIGPYARRYGRAAARKVLELYYVLRADSTSVSDKVLIGLALAYVLVPGDVLPFRKFGVFGLLDDALSLAVVYRRMQCNITPEITFKVEMMLDKWFEGQSAEVVE